MGSQALSPPRTVGVVTVISSLEHEKPGGEVLPSSLGGGENNTGRERVDGRLRHTNQLENKRSSRIRDASALVDTTPTSLQGRKTVAPAVGDDLHPRLQFHPAGNATEPHFDKA